MQIGRCARIPLTLATRFATRPPEGSMAGVTAQNQRRVGAAETERVRQGHIDLALARDMRHEIDLRLDGRVVQVERRRGYIVANCERREDGFDRAGCAEQMSDGRLRRLIACNSHFVTVLVTIVQSVLLSHP